MNIDSSKNSHSRILNPDSSLITFTLDGQSISVPKGTTVYNAARGLNIDIPIFCYHDRMPPFGACRMCLVEVEKMPKLQTSCTLEATEGMVVHTQAENAVKGREGILEFLLINHPLDCPICDRGGECPLQDQTVKFGPGKSRFYEEKRRFKKPIPIGPVLMLDRERCIVCARCTRFGDVIAGDHALEFIERGFKTEVGTPDGGPADSKFIGNTIMICPVGALTSNVYRFRARPWDNQPTPTTCPLCPVGCSMILDQRDGKIVRTRSQENKAVNDVWLCDKGWFGYEFSYHPDRLKYPLIRRAGNLEPATWDEALTLVAEKMQQAETVAAWGGNNLTVEENFLLNDLMRLGVGTHNIDHRIGQPILPIAQEGLSAGMVMTIGACEKLSSALLLGLDITEEFPVIWLRLKQAINRGAEITFIGHYAPEIAPHLTKTILHTPGDELEIIKKQLSALSKPPEAIFVGSQYLSSPHRRAILAELKKLNIPLNIMEGRGNSAGARLAGIHPEMGSEPGLSILQVLDAPSWDLLYVIGANPARLPSKLNFLVVQDLFLTPTALQADVVLPTLCFVEKTGSFINIESRLQTLRPGTPRPENLLSDAEIFRHLAEKFHFTFPETQPTPFRAPPSEEIPPSNQARTPQNGSLIATFSSALFDRGQRMQHNPHVSRLIKEPRLRIHPTEGLKRGLQEGDLATVSANGNSLTAKIKLDAKVASGTLVLPLGFEEIPVHTLSRDLINGFTVEVRK